jgi:type IV secretory pathway VirB10-like protein
MEQIAMKDGFTTKVVEPDTPGGAAVLDEAPDENLATQALEDIRNTERLSGFGRFATKMQNLFQASKPSRTEQQTSHLKAAPVMMSAGLLLLLATGLLFLLSKPESADHSHFRQPTGLSGADDRKPVTTSNTDSPVTENQLASNDTGADTQAASRVRGASRRHEDTAGRRFSLGDGGGGNTNPSVAPNPVATSELQNPATVFVANPVSNSVFNPVSNFRDVLQSEIQLPSGTEITAHTTNAISSGLESPVIAIVDRNVQLGDAVVIPQGARVIGYTAGAVKDRINVRFTSLVLPNNREVTISGLALMKDGSAGLVGKVQGSGHPIVAGVARVGTGAAVVATEFAGQGSLNRPFSQADYLRNQLAYEAASEGSRYSNRLQQTTNVPIVTVSTNQSIRIFLLNALIVSDGRIRNPKPAQPMDTTSTFNTEQNQSPEQALAATQTAYIQALEAQLADMRAALNVRKSNGSN